MRVLFNTYPVAFDCPGGGEVQLLQCKRALEERGVEVRLFDLWRPQFDDVDLVHYFSVQGGSMNFCDYVKQRGLPLLVSPVLWLTDDNKHRFPLGEIRDLLHRCDRALPNSRAEAQQLAAAFDVDPSKFTPVPNGIEPQFAEPVDPSLFRAAYGIEGPFVLNVANVEPRKNQLRLAAVARSMNMRLIVLGRIRDREYFRACQHAGGTLLEHVGHVDHADPILKSAYAACDVFALPSLLETPGLAALEAAAQAARLAVTEVGSTREYFGPLAEYCNPLDEASIRGSIERALAAPRDTALRGHVLKNFTWAAAGQALHAAYQQTIAGLRAQAA